MGSGKWLWAGAIGLAAVSLLAGCAGSPGSAALAGSWGSTAAGKPHLTIQGDGSFSGSDGCNRLTGKGSIDGDSISFGPIVSTRMACEGVDEWFDKAARGTVAGNTLTVYDDKGVTIGTLGRSD
ncbi:hypothetical protein ATY41_02530 [Leifsonia xyli subsp. xyli]|uniref:DUF306 domain-containing protein n=2 Tax=Leifsonia xyli subsp. xyli TaxID=59736 RepID=Q6AC16_LEIXX|nr:META domain-containing protein [Leifsonia xyli]AAT90076.1 conserved hypothetical protein [Leifsonia xyli subsp. xyli str. CTCB07]ODA89940.1 hypothetical protein ATY41_02530 [Leifsonia xyli subsp. xyli]